MRTLIKFNVRSCKSIKEATNVALDLGYIACNAPRSEIREKNFKDQAAIMQMKRMGDVMGIKDTGKSICKVSPERAGDSRQNYDLVLKRLFCRMLAKSVKR